MQQVVKVWRKGDGLLGIVLVKGILFLFFMLMPWCRESFGQAGRKGTVEYFSIDRVKLLEGPFLEAQQVDRSYLLLLEAKRLLAPYWRESGLPVRVPSYGNWENSGLDGHLLGHYLSALSYMYASTGEERMKDSLQFVLRELQLCANAGGDGYIGGIPGGRKMWEEIRQGKIVANGFSLNSKWVPLYNVHKLLAGLWDAYKVGGEDLALTLLKNWVDWFDGLTRGLSEEQVQEILKSEHGGINEVFARLFELTGEVKYLEWAVRWSDRRILNPLLQQKDQLTGLHANTQIPKVVGYQVIGRAQENEGWRKAADFFWHQVVYGRSISIGGNSVREHFHSRNSFREMLTSREGPETCNSYNMLRLTRELFLENPRGEWMDYYERTLWNHILSSQHPQGGFVYFTPIRPGHYRVYSLPQEGFWCCVGTGLENHARYGESIYAKKGNDLLVNLYVASQLDWKERRGKVKMETDLSDSGKVQILLEEVASSSFSIFLRIPDWSVAEGFQVRVNGKLVKGEVLTIPGYLQIFRKWKKGDQITVQQKLKFRLHPMPDGSGWTSLSYGPWILAASLGTMDTAELFADGGRMSHIASGKLHPLQQVPVVVKKETGTKGVQGEGKIPLGELEIPGVWRKDSIGWLMDSEEQFIRFRDSGKVKLRPFFQMHGQRYALYFPWLEKKRVDSTLLSWGTAGKWMEKIEELTIDRVYAGEQQPEQEHQVQGKQMVSGVFAERRYRSAGDWFSYRLTAPGKERKMQVFLTGIQEGVALPEVLVSGQKLRVVKQGEWPEEGVWWALFDLIMDQSSTAVLTHETNIELKISAAVEQGTGKILSVQLIKSTEDKRGEN